MKRNGFTLVELLAAMSTMTVVLLGTMTLLVTGLKSFKKTSTDVDITNQNANAMRKIGETLRQSMNVAITNSGKTISFNLPKMGSVDPVTGETELMEPLTSDGVLRTYTVDFTTGKLTANPGNKVLVSNISPKDPQEGSSQYNQAYTPFQLTSIGSYRAITINLITTQNVVESQRFIRMKSSTVVRNAR